jgi:hypothetical protein
MSNHKKAAVTGENNASRGHFITLTKGGTAERQVKLSTLDIPSLWHIAATVGGEAEKQILEAWHLAHDLKRELIDAKDKQDSILRLLKLPRNQWTQSDVANAIQEGIL